MKKSLLISAAMLLGLCTTASAMEQLTRTNYAEKIVDGAVIALQCKDGFGGMNYFFNGNTAKTPHLTYQQLWRVVAVESSPTKFYLQRLSDNKYIANPSGTNVVVALCDAQSDAAIFSATFAVPDGTWNKPNETTLSTATAPTIRFIVESKSAFLNTQDRGSTPKFTDNTKTAAYSVWFVYSFDEQDVVAFQRETADDFTIAAEWTSKIADHYIKMQANPTTQVRRDDEGWYMIYNVSQNKFLKQDGQNLVFEEIALSEGEYPFIAPANDNAGYVFKVNPAEFSDYGNSYANIVSAYGSYVALINNTSTVSAFPRSFNIMKKSEADYVLVDKTFYDGTNYNNFCAAANAQQKFIQGLKTNDIETAIENQSVPDADIFRFYPVEFAEEGEDIVTFTVQMKYDGKIVYETEITNTPGESISLETPTFFNDKITIEAPANGDEPIVVELQNLTLPFKYTETTDNVIWQCVRQGSSNISEYWAWYYDGTTTLHTRTLPENGTKGITDAELWAFVGDFNNGFRIYNKAAGFDSYLINSGQIAQLGTAEGDDAGNGLWKPVTTNNLGDFNWDAYCCFCSVATENASTRDHINMQQFNTGTGLGNLKFGPTPGPNSTCWFRAPSHYMLDYAAGFTFGLKDIEGHKGYDHVIKQVPEEAVGARNFPEDADFMTSGPGIIAAAEADPYDLDAAEALKQLIADYDSQVELNQFDQNKWYRILSPCYGTYIRTGHDDMSIYAGPAHGAHSKDYHTLFKFNRVGGPDNDPLYTLYSQGLYIGRVEVDQEVAQTDDASLAGQFGPFDADDEPSIYGIGDFKSDGVDATTNHQVYLHISSDAANTAIIGGGKSDAGSHFILMPADDIDFDLDYTLEGKNVGFGFFPYAVTAATPGTTLYFVHEAKGQLSTSETATVPANTAFLAVNADKTVVSLSIVPETATPAARVQAREAAQKVMAGTLRPASATAEDYVVGTTTDGALGFVKAKTEASVKGNFVYIPADNLSDEAKDSDELPLTDPTTTGISEINASNGTSTVLYDLSGRRVSSPKSGIFVTAAGKKIVL